jgi:hypothetical protein
MIADSATRVMETSHTFQFHVGEEDFVLPPLRYNPPVRILLPPVGASVPLDDLEFVWAPYPGAATYDVTVNRVVREGNSTSFPGSGTAREVAGNVLTLAAWREAAARESTGPRRAGGRFERDDDGAIQAGGSYNVEVRAYDSRRTLLSSSQTEMHDRQSHLFAVAKP